MKLNHFSKTVVGLVRKANEDSIGHIITPNKSNINVRIVCDGMGGHIGGAKASNIAINSIREYFLNTPNPVPQVALNDAISFANLQIFGSAQAEPEFKGMGTTCTVLLESEGLIYIAHVGDSRIYIHTDEKLYRITKDHSYVQGLVDKGEISDQQMETHPNKNQLTRALGIAAEVEAEVASKPILAKSGDFFLLCSDGLNGLINDRMINSVIKTNNTLETKCDNLITMAEAAGGHDNISVDLIEVLDSEHIKTQFVNKNNEDLIDTKTKQIVIDNHNQIKKSSNSIKNKVFVSSIVLGIFIIGCLVWKEYQPQKIIVIIDPPHYDRIDTVKVVAKAGWGKNKLRTELYNKVIEIVGEDNYCKDCPVYYKKESDEPISIHKYREQVKNLDVGDYLMVTIKNNKIDKPEINNNKKIENIENGEPVNIYSVEVEAENERKAKEIESEKERLEKERLEKERLEKEEQKLKEEEEKEEIEFKKVEIESSGTGISVKVGSEIFVNANGDSTEKQEEKQEVEEEKQEEEKQEVEEEKQEEEEEGIRKGK